MSREVRKKQTLAEENAALKAALKRLQSATLGANITKVLRDIIKWGSMVAMTAYASHTALGYAGKETIADMRFSATATATADAKSRAEIATRFDIAVQTAVDDACGTQNKVAVGALSLAFFTSFICLLFGRHQKRLRMQVIEKLAPYQERYERERDPARSSSHLTPGGQTRPEDDE